MSTKEKLKARVLLIPSDLKYAEMKSFLVSIGFNESNKGTSSGSRVLFVSDSEKLMFHKPHGNQPMKKITIKQIISVLKRYNRI